MKILIANTHLTEIGGTELWTLTMAKEFVRRGVETHVFSPCVGEFAKQYIEPICPVFQEQELSGYDLMLINHATCFQLIKQLEKGTPAVKIYTSHSAWLPIERCQVGTDACVCVSELIAEKEKCHGWEPVIIRNGINFDRFKPETRVNDELKNVFLMSNYKQAIDFVGEICQELNLNFSYLQEKKFDFQDEINKCDLAIGIGRSAANAMACNRNVICTDWRDWMSGFSGVGFISEENYQDNLRYLFSGKEQPRTFTKEELKQEILKYNSKINLRNLATKDFDVRFTAQKYLDLWISIK